MRANVIDLTFVIEVIRARVMNEGPSKFIFLKTTMSQEMIVENNNSVVLRHIFNQALNVAVCVWLMYNENVVCAVFLFFSFVC